MQPLIGGHVSTAGGLWKAIEYAGELGATTIQIFGASPRQWGVKMPGQADIERYGEALRKSNIQSVYLHAAYLVNLASPDEALRAKSVKSLTEHLQIAEAIGAQGLIFHVGSGKEAPKGEAAKKVVSGMKEVLKAVPGRAQLILENSAGGGAKLGSNAKEVGSILKRVESPRAKVCFDTAHAYEAGVIERYTPPLIKQMLIEWDTEVGLDNIVVLHANDSKTPFDSHSDRHENIGEGYIGMQGFRNLAHEPRLKTKPWILEVPGFQGLGPDRKNIELLKMCFE
ncbi:MAG: hypothetical protein A3I31_02315 [Candidatus Colwellbacteria bacterium RIFCSPLOWO2_02_FULL_44_20b]|uniref:Probable endonuclease 4 n=1 Tax=Candidatus Colwellbacteria bacterium RIFCSPLOWO2_02_FULL_44_20b TaxID=1797691 RepID=A0A1G1Z3W7_9BACT|nr:MAG: hypothetical protein A3I31_02315 [Candidatus Colwellbacteria bacterium RIFCSPLOWO2_02_FULL_44_20b]